MNPKYQKLIVVRIDYETELYFPIGTLTFDGEYYTFEYIKEYNLQPLMNFPDLNRTYQSKELFAFFANRVMSKYRPDYESHLSKYGLSGNNLDVMEYLGRTQAIKQTDNYKVVFNDEKGMI